jgi:hypothetical protein
MIIKISREGFLGPWVIIFPRGMITENFRKCSLASWILLLSGGILTKVSRDFSLKP